MTQILQERKSLQVTLSNGQQQWLSAWCATVGLFGIVIAGAAWEVTSAPIRSIFGILNGTGELDLDSNLRFGLAVLGAVTLGWSLTLMAAIRAARLLEPQASKSIWKLIVAAVAIWYVIDSILSIATGFWLNTVSNTLFLAGFLLPIARSGILTD